MFSIVSLQTVIAQTNTKEAQQLYQAMLEKKAEIDDLVKRGGVILESKDDKGNSSAAASGETNDIIIIDMVKNLETLQDVCRRVERTGGKMTTAQLNAFKTELSTIDSKSNQIESLVHQQQSLTGAALQNCWNACKSV